MKKSIEENEKETNIIQRGNKMVEKRDIKKKKRRFK
jgi:hypothetical protein